MKKISVIIPIYNSQKFLSQSIESVLDQTYKNIEIIAIDDGSTDNSLQILNDFKDEIQIFHHQNEGLSFVLNEAIEKMNGTWFKWLSPDDVLFPDSIETLVNEANQQPSNTILYSNWEIIDHHNKILRKFHESNYNDLNNFDFNVRLLDGQQINVNTTLIPHSIFEKGCVFRNLEDPVTIDYDFFIRAGLNYDVKFHLVDKILLKYRVHSNQFSHKNIAKSLKNISILREEILSRLEPKNIKAYKDALKKYKKQKPISKKSMDMGLKLVTSLLPQKVSDNLLIFYLNKIRSTR